MASNIKIDVENDDDLHLITSYHQLPKLRKKDEKRNFV